MKRSEMQNEIKSIIMLYQKEFLNGDLTFGCLLNDISNDVLKIIEEKGMIPPAYMKPVKFESDGKQYPLVPGDFQNEQGIWCTPGHWGWESEE